MSAAAFVLVTAINEKRRAFGGLRRRANDVNAKSSQSPCRE
jgi:hypothetical protein